MTEKQDFRHDSLQDQSSLASYLSALIEGFDSGRLTFSNDSDEFTLTPSGLVDFELRASRRREKAQLTLKFSWSEGRRGSGPLAINGADD